MKKLFYAATLALVLFEFANVYFIMPLPGSQHVRSIDIAYRLFQMRWMLRGVFGALILGALPFAWRGSRRAPLWTLATVVALAVVAYLTNVQMSADRIFLAPKSLVMRPVAQNRVARSALVVGVAFGDQARAYPIRFLGYHHHVRDTVGGREILVSYCTVCRTGRVFDPMIDGKSESFRLVGMDHFNAMFEDRSTRSW